MSLVSDRGSSGVVSEGFMIQESEDDARGDCMSLVSHAFLHALGE